MYVEAVTPNVTVLGDNAFREVNRLNEVIWLGPYSDKSGVLIRRGRDIRDLFPCMQRRGHVKT